MEDRVIGAYSVVPVNSEAMQKAANIEVGAYGVERLSKEQSPDTLATNVTVSTDEEDIVVLGNMTEGQVGTIIIGATAGVITFGPIGLVVGVAGGALLSTREGKIGRVTRKAGKFVYRGGKAIVMWPIRTFKALKQRRQEAKSKTRLEVVSV